MATEKGGAVTWENYFSQFVLIWKIAHTSVLQFISFPHCARFFFFLPNTGSSRRLRNWENWERRQSEMNILGNDSDTLDQQHQQQLHQSLISEEKQFSFLAYTQNLSVLQLSSGLTNSQKFPTSLLHHQRYHHYCSANICTALDSHWVWH